MPARRTDRAQFYSTVRPLATHVVTCEDDECPQWRDGFVVALPFDQSSLAESVRDSGRMFGEFWISDGEVTVMEWGPFGHAQVDLNTLATKSDGFVFRFPPGTDCFATHRRASGPPVMRWGRGTQHQLNANREWNTETDPRAFVERKRDTIERAFESAKREGVHEMIAERADAQKE